MVDIQTGDLGNEKDIHSFLDYLSSDKKMSVGSEINRKLHLFMFDLE